MPFRVRALIVLALASGAAAQSPMATLTVGICSSKKAVWTYADYEAVIEAIRRAAAAARSPGVAIRFRTFHGNRDCLGHILKGKVDIARVCPAVYCIAKEKDPSILLLGKEVDASLPEAMAGVIVVRPESPVRGLEDLAGRRIAFGDEVSAIGRYLPQALLVDRGIDAGKLAGYSHEGGHLSALRALLRKECDAASLRAGTLAKLPREHWVRVVATFARAGTPWIARSGLPEPLTRSIADGLCGLNAENGLSRIGASRIVTAKDEDFEIVRKAIERAAAFEKKHLRSRKRGDRP
ncbi:MAG: hypothetical protein Fur0037_24360 [Planctomycetota bacterium]